MLPPHGLSASPSFASPGRGDLIAGRYRIERKLGAGGMGIVVAAIDEQTGDRVAVKLLLPEGPAPAPAFRTGEDSGVVERSNRHIEMSTRLLREASAAARLSSSHVARVLDVGRLEGGDPFVVMEMLDGVDLHRYAKERGPLPIVETVDLVLQACDAIFEAHERGIVHRDLKPANLFLTRRADGSPFVKVLDFGISKVLGADDNQLTATTDMLGSPLYMAPEQIRDARDVDTRTDVWSLGTILYRLIAGRPAFEGQGSAATLAAIIGDAPYPLRALRPDVPPDLEAIVQHCLEKDRTRRIQSVRELAIALQRFTAAPPGPLFAAATQSGSSYPAAAQSGPTYAASQSGSTPPVGALPPPPHLPSSISVGPSAVTLPAPSGRSAAVFAIIGVVVGALVAGSLAVWRLGATSASEASGAPVSAIGTGAPVNAGSASASETAAASAAPVPSAEPAASASSTATSAATTSTSAATSSGAPAGSGAPVKPKPIRGRPSDDPLGDRL